MGYKLYLDDYRTPDNPEEWLICRSYDQFVNLLKTMGIPDFVSFDHDLADEHVYYFFDNGGHENPPNPQEANFTEKTGYDCARYLIDMCMDELEPLPKYRVHSANPVGTENIQRLLENFRKHQEQL